MSALSTLSVNGRTVWHILYLYIRENYINKSKPLFLQLLRYRNNVIYTYNTDCDGTIKCITKLSIIIDVCSRTYILAVLLLYKCMWLYDITVNVHYGRDWVYLSWTWGYYCITCIVWIIHLFECPPVSAF